MLYAGYLGESGSLYPDMTPASYLRYIGEIRHLKVDPLHSALERVAKDCQLEEVWNKTRVVAKATTPISYFSL